MPPNKSVLNVASPSAEARAGLRGRATAPQVRTSYAFNMIPSEPTSAMLYSLVTQIRSNFDVTKPFQKNGVGPLPRGIAVGAKNGGKGQKPGDSNAYQAQAGKSHDGKGKARKAISKDEGTSSNKGKFISKGRGIARKAVGAGKDKGKARIAVGKRNDKGTSNF